MNAKPFYLLENMPKNYALNFMKQNVEPQNFLNMGEV